ncbi:MAG: hypothetical protein EHM59_21215, partial [Betaproteobacteria bacterium]
MTVGGGVLTQTDARGDGRGTVVGGVGLRIARRTGVWAALLGVVCGNVAAQDYPTRPIRWIVPFPPGGSVDAVARRIGPALSAQLGQQVILDNRSGASGNIAAELVARAAPDGYTLMNHTVPFVVNTFLYRRVPYDVLN